MSITTIQRNYKKLENRLETLERVIKDFFSGELKEEKLKKLEAISKQLDKGNGQRLASHGEFRRYLKSL